MEPVLCKQGIKVLKGLKCNHILTGNINSKLSQGSSILLAKDLREAIPSEWSSKMRIWKSLYLAWVMVQTVLSRSKGSIAKSLTDLKLTAIVLWSVQCGTDLICCKMDCSSWLQLLKSWQWRSWSHMADWLWEPVWVWVNHFVGGLVIFQLHQCSDSVHCMAAWTHTGTGRRGMRKGIGRGRRNWGQGCTSLHQCWFMSGHSDVELSFPNLQSILTEQN